MNTLHCITVLLLFFSGLCIRSGTFAQSDKAPCRDDLCLHDETRNNQDEFGASETEDGMQGLTDDVTGKPASPGFRCPPLYSMVVRDGVEFCTPMSKEEISKSQQTRGKRCLDGEILVETDSGEMCVPDTKNSAPTECQPGQMAVQMQGRVLCVVPDPNNLNFCPPAHLRVNVDGQLKCHPIFDLQILKEVPTAKGKQKRRNPYKKRVSTKGNRRGGRGGKTARLTTRQEDVIRENLVSELEKQSVPKLVCDKGKVPSLSAGGYICIERVYPTAVCPEGQIPQISNMGTTCVNCPRGERAVRVDGGVKCNHVSPLSPPQLGPEMCPEGLVPVQTSVGRVCQYVVPPEPQEEPDCPSGAQAVRENGRVVCREIAINCRPGQIVIETKSGESVCGFVSNNDQKTETVCPRGLVQVGDKCVYQPKKPNPCPKDQQPIETDTGVMCIQGNKKRKSKCPDGATLTATSKGFFCQTMDPSFQTGSMCGHGSVPVQMKHAVECITVSEANLVCMGEDVLVKTHMGFMCRKPQTSLLPALICREGEVVTTDEQGKTICISLSSATERCGQGYRAVPVGGRQYMCRRTQLDLQCPQGFVLKLTAEVPTCISASEPECLELVEGDCKPVTVPGLSPCQEGYDVKVSPSGPGCFLHVEKAGPVPSVDTPDIAPCGGAEGAVRSCDFDISALLAGCNPDCANGGSCVDGLCVCPPGVTGSACHQDIDECQAPNRPSCDHQCVNTFGSYHCACPSGYILSSDGSTCNAKGCVPDCLNNGECRNGECFCERGFEGDHCQTDKDECQLFTGLCQHVCRNTYGGYECICPPGSKLNTDGRTCTNITCVPECKNGGTCENNRCRCPAGYQGIICQFDINECYKKEPCHHVCTNTRGSYRCSCNHGYRLESDGHTCILS